MDRLDLHIAGVGLDDPLLLQKVFEGLAFPSQIVLTSILGQSSKRKQKSNVLSNRYKDDFFFKDI